VWLVELASLSDPALVPQTVAFALGIREQPGRLLTDTLSEYLELKKMLLVLDNCEHASTRCSQLSEPEFGPTATKRRCGSSWRRQL
jgi:predicted ATPase